MTQIAHVSQALERKENGAEPESGNGDSTSLVPALTEPSGDLVLAGDTVAEKTAWMNENQRALVRWLHAWMRKNSLSLRELAEECNVDGSTLSRVWDDKYRHPMTTTTKDGSKIPNPRGGERVDVGGVCEKIRRYKLLCEDRGANNRALFVETSVWSRIDRISREVLVMQCFGFVYGESQIGKTFALEEYQRRNNHGATQYVLTPAGGGKLELLKTIAESMNIPTRLAVDQLKRRIHRWLGPSNLLILDEVHELMQSYSSRAMLQCLGILRQLQEETHCGLLLCGTNAFRDALEEGEFKRNFKQLLRRGILELQLEDKPKWSDLALIWEAYSLEEPRGAALDQVGLIREEMGLGKFCKFLKRGRQLAEKKNRAMTWDDFTTVIDVGIVLRTKPETYKTKQEEDDAREKERRKSDEARQRKARLA